MTERDVHLQTNRFKYLTKIRTDDKYHYFPEPAFALKDEIACMKGAKWLGREPIPEKTWRVDNCRRNNFNIAYLEGKNPFARYKAPLDEKLLKMPVPRTRINWYNQEITLFAHQIEFILHILQRRQCIIAGEMGTAKTLAAFVAMEQSLVPEVWYVAPKSALASVKLEAMTWKLRTKVRWMTYDELKKVIMEWVPGKAPPKFVVFDESSRLKTLSSQRTGVAAHLAESMRQAYGDDAYIVLMSGSPAPKSPLDWYSQCEIACPGYIREGTIFKFEQRLCILQPNKDTTGFSFNQRLGWRDGNPNICNICGKHKDKHAQEPHTFIPVTNEVENLYKRLGGLAIVKFKKDCLDLPDKLYRRVKLKPSRDLMSAARIITAKGRSVIESMTLLRELSDGFQYTDVVEKTAICESCKGTRSRFNQAHESEPCFGCSGTGVQNSIRRDVKEVASPKIEALTDLLDEVEETERCVIFAGFQASIDRVCAHVTKLGWNYIRVDGRGWKSSLPSLHTDIAMLQEFQNPTKPLGKIVFVGHPGSAGMGITLTASPMTIYFSNDFNAESRVQSEDRIHRAGMDTQRGATIVDLLLLPTDLKVLDNLSRKRELQSISLGELQSAIDNYSFTTSG